MFCTAPKVKPMHRLLSLSLAAGLSLATGLTASYDIGDDYAVKASARGVDATFSDLSGTVVFDADALAASRFDVSVSAASIATGNRTQDKHARGDGWLDAGAHPRISFRSKAFAKTDSGYAVAGDLTIKGVAKPVTIPFTFDGGVFEGATAVAREDFGVDGPFLIGGLVGDVVEVRLRVPVE